MNKTAKALTIFENFNCCQSVLLPFCEEFQLEENTALKLASGFGGGMACGETCGAVTGAYMVIGLKHGFIVNNPDQKAATKEKIQKFSLLFTQKHNSLLCKELLGTNISTPEGQELAKEKDLFNTHCPKFIETACNLLEQEF